MKQLNSDNCENGNKAFYGSGFFFKVLSTVKELNPRERGRYFK